MPTLDGKRVARRLPVGAEPVKGDGVHFRVWAPLRRSVHVVCGERATQLEPEEDGYFSGLAAHARPGMTYRFALDGGDAFPDPASRFQPEGPHGPSLIVDAAEFEWTDAAWPGVSLPGQIVYEMHAGTFTSEGTWEAAIRHLPELAFLGVTVIELMPVADFTGRFGWGYDGVNWFAPCRNYGAPDDLRRFIDAAHALQIGVILDVVYNHFGPDGNYIGQYSSDYVTGKHTTDWGDAINYDGKNSGPVREFVTANAAYWISEFHFDGLRLDATQNIYDESSDHILAAVTRAVRNAAGGRKTLVIAENEPQETKLIRSTERNGFGMDGLWNDDFHHSAVVALTGRNEAYYSDYLGNPQEFISAAKYGYLYQGQWYKWQKKPRGTPSLDAPRSAFVTFIENHDQIANSPRGFRVRQLASAALYRAMTAVLLLGPSTPMLFQGQEFGASAPFLFFADMPDWLVSLVRDGRKEFLTQWRSIRTEAMLESLPDPCSFETFERCKLDHAERHANTGVYHFHRDLIRLRQTDPVMKNIANGSIDGAVLSPHAFVLRYFGPDGDDRLLIVNLGIDLRLSPAPEPLLAPPEERFWRIVFSTEEPQYGGSGAPPFDSEAKLWMAGHAAALLAPQQRNPAE